MAPDEALPIEAEAVELAQVPPANAQGAPQPGIRPTSKPKEEGALDRAKKPWKLYGAVKDVPEAVEFAGEPEEAADETRAKGLLASAANLRKEIDEGPPPDGMLSKKPWTDGLWSVASQIGRWLSPLWEIYGLYKLYDRYGKIKKAKKHLEAFKESREAGSTTVKEAVGYGIKKIRRRFITAICRFALGFAKVLADLILFLTGGVAALASAAVKLSASLAKGAERVYRSLKGVWKALTGQRGKARGENAAILVGAAREGDNAAAQVLWKVDAHIPPRSKADSIMGRPHRFLVPPPEGKPASQKLSLEEFKVALGKASQQQLDQIAFRMQKILKSQ